MSAMHEFATKLLSHLVTPAFVLDANSKVIIWNKAVERLTGTPATEVLGTDRHWHAFYHEPRPCLADLVVSGKTDGIEKLYSEYRDPNGTSCGLYAENWVKMPRTGAQLYLSINAGPVFDDNGRLIAVVETLNDLTVRKKAELALERLASQDGLTGLSNRRVLDETVDREWNRLARDRAPLSFLLIDVDCFKRYNDALGHQAGDECLRTVAKALGGAVMRPADLVARYGGEEFAAVLPGTDMPGAMVVAKRIGAAVAAQAIPHPDSVAGGCVTVSIGVATELPQRGEEYKRLIKAADAALYRAKAHGRNRVECF